MTSNSPDSSSPFALLESDSSHGSHLFEAYRYDSSSDEHWSEVVSGCLRCWKITAQAFYERIPETGFQKLGLIGILNAHGTAQLPPTPAEDANVTKVPAITDLTEVLALRLLQWKRSSIVLPYPRVLHKEVFTLQHHGVDALGYEPTTNGYVLYVIEIMASADLDHPPTTVSNHLRQLLDSTLNVEQSPRLLRDLQTVHDESADSHKDILNGFITVVLEGSFSDSGSVVAMPLLVRRFREHGAADWTPFINKTCTFEQAIIPSKVLFLSVECHASFSGLLNLVKQTVNSPGQARR